MPQLPMVELEVDASDFDEMSPHFPCMAATNLLRRADSSHEWWMSSRVLEMCGASVELSRQEFEGRKNNSLGYEWLSPNQDAHIWELAPFSLKLIELKQQCSRGEAGEYRAGQVCGGSERLTDRRRVL
ncbi:hypothetical protein B0H19DRAFT_1086623 [Mycena capillaripes]|nr:hypothetical protein B0H19DRAFT_1086623 [Mycena capillaripes]